MNGDGHEKARIRQVRGIRADWSGTPGSNRRPSPWQGDAPATLWPLGLIVDPRQDRGSQGSVERHAFRLRSPFKMLPHSGREANRARDGGTGLGAFSRPTPTSVDGDSLRRDTERVWVATDLGLVEVHLGHLAQRRAGRLAKLLTSRLLHSASSYLCDVARHGLMIRIVPSGASMKTVIRTRLFSDFQPESTLGVHCVLQHCRERVGRKMSPPP